jgi:hypothetical protein
MVSKEISLYSSGNVKTLVGVVPLHMGFTSVCYNAYKNGRPAL